MKSVTADGSLRSPTGGVEELYPTPHIHEQMTAQKWLEMMRQIFNEVIKKNNFTPEEWKKVKIKVIYKKVTSRM